MNRARRILNRAIRAKSDPPMPPSTPPDAPRGSFLGGLCQGCLCHPVAPWSRLAASPRSPGSRLPGSALGPFVTLHSPRPAPLGGLAAAAGGATASLSPPPCHSTLQRRARSRAALRSRPHQTHPLLPWPPPHCHAWLRPRSAPSHPHPLDARRQPPPAAPGARGPRPPRCPPPVPAICAGGPGDRGGRPRPLHFFQECAGPHAPRQPQQAAATFRACLMTLAQPTPFSPESATSF